MGAGQGGGTQRQRLVLGRYLTDLEQVAGLSGRNEEQTMRKTAPLETTVAERVTMKTISIVINLKVKMKQVEKTTSRSM